MVIGKLKYLIEPVRGHTSHRLDAILMGTWSVKEQPCLVPYHGSWTSVLEDGGPVP
jgi:hypothetical protein